jgi:hypothetical protein
MELKEKNYIAKGILAKTLMIVFKGTRAPYYLVS